LGAIFNIPYFLMLNSKDPVIIVLAQVIELGIALLGYSVTAAFYPESFKTKYRYSGASFPYHLGTAISGGVAPILAGILVATLGGPINAAVYIGLIGVAYSIAAAISIYLLGETKGELKE